MTPSGSEAGRPAAPQRWLPLIAGLETGTVMILFVNRATVHLPAVTSLIGPLHGAIYLATVACALLAPLPRVGKVLGILLAIGGWLALAYGAGRPEPRTRRSRLAERLDRAAADDAAAGPNPATARTSQDR